MARFALPGLLLSASPLSGQSIQFEFSLRVHTAQDSIRISLVAQNRGHDPAYEVQAELRGLDALPRPMAGEIAPGERAAAEWKVDADRWRADLRQIAAVRIRYHDAAGTWAGIVTTLGDTIAATVSGPTWPDDPSLRVTWAEPSAEGGAVWWGPIELGIEGQRRWRSSDGRAAVRARLAPPSDITGWETEAFLLVLPDDVSEAGRVVSVPIDADSARALWRPDFGLLAGWTGLTLVAWLGAATIGRRRLRPTLPTFTAVLLLGGLALTLFPPGLLFLNTSPAGGDFASHIVALDQLRQVFLPEGRLFGWSMDQYAGFPLFLFYFPLAFLVIVALSAWLPLTVALKVGSLTGTLLLPFAWVVSLRWLGASRPARWIAPAAALAFLLIETQAAWGGTLPSLLAGEFAYALGFPLAWLATSHAWRTRDQTTGWWPAAVLLALAGLAHGYTLVCAALGMALLLFHPRLWWRRMWHVARIGLLAFGLLAWWLIPLLANLPWTNGFRERWAIDGWSDILPPAVAIALGIVLAGVLWRLLARQRPIMASGQRFLVVFGAALFAVYELGYSLGVVDIRFLPMMQGALLLAGCWELGAWIDRARLAWRPVLAAGAIAAVTAAAGAAVVYIPSWARWNLNGMERTSRWADFDGVMRAVAGGIGQPRVAFEHHPDHNAAGTIRAFELLPWFSGRATLEGLYFQSAILAPAVFYLQSETSLGPSCPLPAYECGSFRPAEAGAHLRLLGASDLIAYTDSLKDALARSADFEERTRSGVFTVYRLSRPPRLIEPVGLQPVFDRHPDWRQEGYDWFRAASDLDVPLVLKTDPDSRWSSVERYRPGRVPRASYATRPRAEGALTDGVIRIRTDTPGHPLLVKVGFHPGWRASDGSPIELVAPGLMLVTPRSRSLTLSWSSGRPGRLGLAVTVLALAALAILIARREPAHGGSQRLPLAGRAGWIGIAALMTLAVVGAGLMVRRHPPIDFPRLLDEGQRHLADKRFPLARRSFERMLETDTPHGLRDDAAFHRALVEVDAGDREAALTGLASFLEAYPVSTYRAEALVRQSDLLAENGLTGPARSALEEAVEAPLAPDHWRSAARERLDRLSTTATREPIRPAIARGSVSLFVPVYDEADILIDTMPRLLRAAEEVADQVQLVIVDNGSTDATFAVARDLATRDSRIVPLRIAQRGVGSALKAALPHLRHDFVIAVDADLAIDLAFVGEALRRLQMGADVVVGAKRSDASDRPFLRVLVSELFVRVMRVGLGVPFHDVSIGAKAYRKDLLERYEHRIGVGSNYVIDVLVQAWREGFQVEELSVACHDNRKSHFNLLHEGVYRFGHLFGLVLRRQVGLLGPVSEAPSRSALPRTSPGGA